MDFQRTSRTLRTLEKKDDLTLEETMGVMTDILADVQAVMGVSPDKLDTGDLRAAVTGLSMIGRTLLQVKKTKSDEFGTAADRKKRLDKIYDEVESLCNETDNAGEQIEELSSKQAELESKKAELEKKMDEVHSKEQSCKSMEDEIRRLSEVDMEKLDIEKRDIMKKLNDAKERFNDEYNEVERLKEISRMLENDIGDKTSEADRLKDEIEKKRSSLNEYESVCVEYEKKIEKLMESADSSKIRAEELKSQYEKTQNRIEELSGEELPELAERLGKIKSQLKALNDEKESVIARIREKEKENDQIRSDIEERKRAAEEETARNKEICDQLETDISNMTIERENLKKRIDELNTQMADIEKELRELKVQLKANEDLSQNHREEIARYRDITIPASTLTLRRREQALDEYASRNNELKI